VAKSRPKLPLYTLATGRDGGRLPSARSFTAATMVTAGVRISNDEAGLYLIYRRAPIGLRDTAFVRRYRRHPLLPEWDAGQQRHQAGALLHFRSGAVACMFVGVRLAVYSAGMFHLEVEHVLQGLLFMGAGAVMHTLHDRLDIRKMGGTGAAAFT